MFAAPFSLPTVSVGHPPADLLPKTVSDCAALISTMVSESSPASVMNVAATPPSSSVNPTTPTPPTPPLKVLVIDDNEINLRILKKILEKHFGHLIETTATLQSGVSALVQLSRSKYDLIFLDIEMPVLSGVETTREIRNAKEYPILEHNRTIPIIAVTTNTLQAERQLYAEAGMNGCVGKPIHLAELKLEIENVFGGLIITLQRPEEFSNSPSDA